MRRLVAIVVVLLWCPAVAWAQFANIGSAEGEFAFASVLSRTVASVAVPDLGTNRVGVVLVTRMVAFGSVAGVTWNGDAMTERVDINGAAEMVAIYDLVGMDDNGTYDIVVTWDATNGHTVHIVVVWADHADTITFDDADSGSGTTEDPAITSAGTAGAASYLMLSTSAHEAITITGLTGGTQLQVWDEGNRVHQTGYSQSASSGNQTHTHDFSSSEQYVIGSVMYKAGTASAGTTCRGPLLGVGCD